MNAYIGSRDSTLSNLFFRMLYKGLIAIFFPTVTIAEPPSLITTEVVQTVHMISVLLVAMRFVKAMHKEL